MGVAANRRALVAHERRTAAALVAAYGLHPAVHDWTRRISPDAQPSDVNLSSAVFAFRAAHVGYALTAQQIISRAQQIAADMGRRDAQALAGLVTSDKGTIADYSDGAGSTTYLDQIANDAPGRLAAALMARLGVGGLHAAAVGVISATVARILLVARQAIIDAYRAAQAAVFAQAPDVNGWIWVSALASNTCGFCFAMHGTWHPDSESLDSHLYCQCVQVPTSLSAAEYEASDPQMGVDLFAALDTAAQRRILGPARYGLYAQGIPLDRMVGDRGLHPVYVLRRSA